MANLNTYETFMYNIEHVLNNIAEMEAEERGIPDVAYHVGAESEKASIIFDAYEEFQAMHEENPDDIEKRCHREIIEELEKEMHYVREKYGDLRVVKDPYDRVFVDAMNELKLCIEKRD